MSKDIFPQIGKTYKCYDDGKVKKSREYNVTVKNIIEIDKLDNSYESIKLRKLLNYNIKEYDWVFGHLDHKYLLEITSDEYENLKDKSLYMAKTLNGDWFGLGYWFIDEDGVDNISSWFNSGLLWFNKTWEVE